jgi:hypothetical protein
MDKDKLKTRISSIALNIAEKCAVGAAGTAALVASGLNTAEASVPSKPMAQVGEPVTVARITDGAILLDIVQRDPVTGEMVARHYSHASHASHSSHSSHTSHYSSR